VAAKVVGNWRHRLLAEAMEKWAHEVVRRRKALKAVAIWKHGESTLRVQGSGFRV